MRHCFVLAILVCGCIADVGRTDSTIEGEGEEDGEGEENGGDVDRDECKIEGSEIGREGAVLQLGAKTVTFGSWVQKSDSPGDYVGFSVTVTGGTSVSYVVKAGGERHPSTATTWMHPAGPDGGPDAPGISHVDMCDDSDAGDDDGDGEVVIE
jgi:hypothetical protein